MARNHDQTGLYLVAGMRRNVARMATWYNIGGLHARHAILMQASTLCGAPDKKVAFFVKPYESVADICLRQF